MIHLESKGGESKMVGHCLQVVVNAQSCHLQPNTFITFNVLVNLYMQFLTRKNIVFSPGRDSHMKGAGMLGNFELNPWTRPKLFWTPKRDHLKTQTNKKYNGVLPRTP